MSTGPKTGTSSKLGGNDQLLSPHQSHDVSRVRLYLRHPISRPIFRFIRPGGIRDNLPALQLLAFVDLKALVQVGPDAAEAAFPECIIDTGSHLINIPERIWSQLKPRATIPLPFDPSMPYSQRRVAFAGGVYPYYLAELTFQLHDLVGGMLQIKVVAQLLQDGGRLTTPMTIGLRGGVLDGRIFRSYPDPGAPFGEQWLLEDP